MGDININFEKWENHDGYMKRLSDLIKNWIKTIGFGQIIEGGTHRGRNSETPIDHIWVNCPRRLVKWINEINLSSDHNIVGV